MPTRTSVQMLDINMRKVSKCHVMTCRATAEQLFFLNAHLSGEIFHSMLDCILFLLYILPEASFRVP